jgi:hypothetical protein
VIATIGTGSRTIFETLSDGATHLARGTPRRPCAPFIQLPFDLCRAVPAARRAAGGEEVRLDEPPAGTRSIGCPNRPASRDVRSHARSAKNQVPALADRFVPRASGDKVRRSAARVGAEEVRPPSRASRHGSRSRPAGAATRAGDVGATWAVRRRILVSTREPRAGGALRNGWAAGGREGSREQLANPNRIERTRLRAKGSVVVGCTTPTRTLTDRQSRFDKSTVARRQR